MKKTNYPLLHKKCSVKFTSQIEPSVKIKDSVKVIREPKSRLKYSESTDLDECDPSKFDDGAEKYAIPELNSCLRYAKRILELKGQSEPQKYYSIDDLTPYEKKIVNKKISEKISFPPDVQVYKNLIPLEVPTDQIKELCLTTNKKRKEYTKKDIIPKLSDFYTPKRKAEYKVIADTPIVSQPPIRAYNGMALHQKISSWHEDEF